MIYIMMMLARDVIDILRHTSSTCIFGCLVCAIVNGGLGRYVMIHGWYIIEFH
jgi:hypothetical protein